MNKKKAKYTPSYRPPTSKTNTIVEEQEKKEIKKGVQRNVSFKNRKKISQKSSVSEEKEIFIKNENSTKFFLER